jgi:hypothetical protein
MGWCHQFEPGDIVKLSIFQNPSNGKPGNQPHQPSSQGLAWVGATNLNQVILLNSIFQTLSNGQLGNQSNLP